VGPIAGRGWELHRRWQVSFFTLFQGGNDCVTEHKKTSVDVETAHPDTKRQD
jgi:hypothetical protein